MAFAHSRETAIEHTLIGLQLLNVQVPLFFKEVIDTLNIPVPVDSDAQSTVWVVCGSVILACTWPLYFPYVAVENG
jgi:hypothetical protein